MEGLHLPTIGRSLTGTTHHLAFGDGAEVRKSVSLPAEGTVLTRMVSTCASMSECTVYMLSRHLSPICSMWPQVAQSVGNLGKLHRDVKLEYPNSDACNQRTRRIGEHQIALAEQQVAQASRALQQNAASTDINISSTKVPGSSGHPQSHPIPRAALPHALYVYHRHFHAQPADTYTERRTETAGTLR